MNTKSSIFASGEGTSETPTFDVHEWNENRSYTEKVIFFLLVLCFKIATVQFISNASAINWDTQRFS